MNRFLWWALWLVCYFIGFTVLTVIDAPAWGAVIGGWIMGWGIMGRIHEAG